MINVVHWQCSENNWGDAIVPFIAKKLSGQDIKSLLCSDEGKEQRYAIVGSINQLLSSDNTIIWGTGFISESSILKVVPKKICAVRGPLTQAKFLNAGISCPDVYGDPALLMPRFYSPSIKKRYKYGIIPHYVDANNDWVLKHKDNPDVKIIRISNDDNFEVLSHRFINDLLGCETILSSSLHGLIVADAYGIPSYWLEISNNVIGNGFKFRDYFLSVGRPVVEPIKPIVSTSLEELSNNFYQYKIDIDLDKLLTACPFKYVNNF